MDEIKRLKGKRRFVRKKTTSCVKLTNFAELRPLSSPTGPCLGYCSKNLPVEDTMKLLIKPPAKSLMEEDINKRNLFSDVINKSTIVADFKQNWSEDVDGQNISQNSKVRSSIKQTAQREQLSEHTNTEDPIIGVYRARLARVTADLQLSKSKLKRKRTELKMMKDSGQSMEYVDNPRFSSTLRVNQLQRERDDLARLVLQLREHTKLVQKQNKELLMQVLHSTQMAALAKEEQVEGKSKLKRKRTELKMMKDSGQSMEYVDNPRFSSTLRVNQLQR
ncbi:hypothetical protein AHF37_07215 [Paragonimus kellicotti]|nr:hypothetical protein AHF37_07215 [Paragonimus kellicotti]